MELRWITITTLLLYIFVFLRMVSPNIGGISLYWNIVMYCLAILLCRPTIKQGFGIGLVSGIIAMMTSKAALPYANLISDPLAATICALMVNSNLFNIKKSKISLIPFIVVFITTYISGSTFVTLTKIFLQLPMNIYLYAMLPAVALVALLGAVAGQLLYLPAFKIFNAKLNKNDKQFSLHDINLTIPQGSFCVITGVNGSGKTSLILNIAGSKPAYLSEITTSKINIADIDILNTQPKKLNELIGVVMADYNAQLVTQTVGDEIAVSLETSGLNAQEIINRRRDLLASVGLSDKEDMPISALSGGQKQRLAIASIMAMNTPIIILDEPVAAIDPEGAKDIYNLLVNLNKRYNKTIIVTEHDLKYVLDIADQLCVIDYGHIDCYDIMQLDSTNLQPEDWQYIAGYIEKLYEQYDGFVITQGTDTLNWTCCALHYMLENLAKPIVVIGSQLTIEEENTDAKFNLNAAFAMASSEKIGVFAVCGGQLIGGLWA